MLIEEYERLPKLTEEEVRKQAEGIFNFLKLTHPYINNKKIFYKSGRAIEEQINFDSVAIEIRALRRDQNKACYRNFKLYRFADTELERLYKFLWELNEKAIPYCLYYSVYAYDNNQLAVTKDGKKSAVWNNKAALNNVVGTQIIVTDFDDITEDEFLLERLKLAQLGLETLDIFTGHGFQSIILLDKMTEDKTLVKKVTNLMLNKGFRIDSKIKDSARIMRLPYTYNCKELSKKDIENPSVIKTFIYSETEKRYNLEYVLERLESLETVTESQATIDIIEDKKIKVEEIEKTEVITENKVVKNVIQLKDTLEDLTYNKNKLKELYTMLNIESLPEPVLKMLEGFRMGYANSMLLFLTLYLKDIGYSRSVVVSAMEILADQDRFNYPWDKRTVRSETKRFYYSNYNWNSIYSSELQEFGYIEYEFKNREIIIIDNHVFDVLNEISSKAFYIYLRLLEDSNYTGKKVYTINEIAQATKVPRRTLVQHLDDLAHKKVRLLDKHRAYKKRGEEYTYQITEFLGVKGFTKINISMLKYLILMVDTKEINPTQLSLCMYIKYVCYNGKSNCTISQETLGQALGLDRTSISKSFKNMEKTRLIRADKIDISDFKFKYSYTIYF